MTYTGTSGDYFRRIFDRDGNKLNEIHSETALVSLGLGPIDYLLLAGGVLAIGRAAIGKFMAKRAAAKKAAQAATPASAPFKYATNEAFIYGEHEVRIVQAPSGTRAFYRRTGGGGISPFGAQPGDWVPFRGFQFRPGGGRFVKPPSVEEFDPSQPLTWYRFHDEEAIHINDWIKGDQTPLTTIDVGEAYGRIQEVLESLGVEVRFPIARSSRR